MFGDQFDLVMRRLLVWFVRTRYRTQIRIALAALIGSVLLGGYLAAKREPPEG